MSFLSAAFLLALPLVAVPVAIHLYRGRQRDVIMWGAMQFLAAAVTKGRRMERLEEWLLMALRFAAVAVLVLALARPMVQSSLFGASAEREVVLVLDNSLSMSRETGGESSADRMKEKAIELVDSLPSGSGVQVLLASGTEWATPETLVADATGRQRLRDLIEAANPTLASADLLECLQAALHLDAPPEVSARRVIVFTDSQSQSWQPDAAGAWQQLAADRDASSLPVSIEVVECGDASPVDNLALTEIRAAHYLIRPKEDAQLTATIANFGDVATPSSEVEWLVEGQVVQKSPLQGLQRQGTTEVSTTLPLPDAGHFQVTCRIVATDQIPLDQQNHAIIEVAELLPMLFVRGDTDRDLSVDAPALVSAALGYKNNEPQSWHSVYRPEVIDAAELATRPLAGYCAVVINNPGRIDGETLDRLDAFVRAGGGLWVALGEATDRADFNRDWYSDGDGLSPFPIDGLEVIEAHEDVAATVHPPSRDHPATVQLANTTQLDIDEARIFQRWRFDKQADDQGQAASILLESGNGRPLVIEKYVGEGRVMLQSFPLDLQWSNLPLLKAYVVMVHDWLGHVSAPMVGRHNLAPGSAIVATAPEDATGIGAVLSSPTGKKIRLDAHAGDVASVVRYSQTRLPGIYTLTFEGDGAAKRSVPFHVAHDAKESLLRPLSDADRRALLEPAGVVLAGDAPADQKQVASAPRRQPFWTTLLIALVFLLVVELLLSNWLARRRAGFAVSAA